MNIAVKMSLFGLVCLLSVGCASTGDDSNRTEVGGGVVSDSDQDWDRVFDDEEVAAFAAAYVEVSNIQQSYQTRIAQAEGSERDELLDESSDRSEEAMLSHGVSPQDFNAIAVRLPDDDELRSRVQAAVQEMEQDRIRETEQRQLESQ